MRTSCHGERGRTRAQFSCEHLIFRMVKYGPNCKTPANGNELDANNECSSKCLNQSALVCIFLKTRLPGTHNSPAQI